MTTSASGAAAAANDDEVLLFGAVAGTAASNATPGLISAMLDSGPGISDLIFSPGRPPQVERHGDLATVPIAELPMLRPEHTARIARDLIGGNPQNLRILRDEGAVDPRTRSPNDRGSASTSFGSAAPTPSSCASLRRRFRRWRT